jgi:hypothetical protein
VPGSGGGFVLVVPVLLWGISVASQLMKKQSPQKLASGSPEPKRMPQDCSCWGRQIKKRAVIKVGGAAADVAKVTEGKEVTEVTKVAEVRQVTEEEVAERRKRWPSLFTAKEEVTDVTEGAEFVEVEVPEAKDFLAIDDLPDQEEAAQEQDSFFCICNSSSDTLPCCWQCGKISSFCVYL